MIIYIVSAWVALYVSSYLLLRASFRKQFGRWKLSDRINGLLLSIPAPITFIAALVFFAANSIEYSDREAKW